MKIAIISGSAGDGRCGVGDYAYELAQHLALDAHVSLYYDHEHGPATPPFPQLTTLRLHPVASYSMFGIKALAAELRGEDFDVVHVQYPGRGYGASLGPGFLLGNLTGMQSRSRLAVTLHEWSTSHPLRRMVSDQMLKYADGVLVNCEAEMDPVGKRLRKGQTLMAIPVGNILSSQRELAEVWQLAAGVSPPELPLLGPDGRVPDSLFHFGLPARGKGVRRLLEALKLLRVTGRPAMLYLAGEFTAGEPLAEELLSAITELELADAVVRLGHLPREEMAAVAQRYMLGVFPFDEGYSSKRSSIAALSELELPLVVGAGSREEHPYYAPAGADPERLAELLDELLGGKAQLEWRGQIARQREYARRFSFANVASSHIDFYGRLRKIDT